MWKYFCTHGQLKNKKKMSNQCHVCEFAELDGGGGIMEKKNYEDANQTEIFTGMKSTINPK